MPYRVRIAEMEALIQTTLESLAIQRASIAKLRMQKARTRGVEAKLNKLLATLARFKNERIKLMERQRLVSK
jgi:hypothetical protein